LKTQPNCLAIHFIRNILAFEVKPLQVNTKKRPAEAGRS
jgi:hypothetical protein